MQIRIQDPKSFRPWIRDGKIRIRDKHHSCATLQKNITKSEKSSNIHRLNRKKTPCLIAVEVSPVRGNKYLVTAGTGVLVPRPLVRFNILLEDSEGRLGGRLHPKAAEFTLEDLNSDQVAGATAVAVARAAAGVVAWPTAAAVAWPTAAAVAWPIVAVAVLGLHVGQHLGLRHSFLFFTSR